MERLRESMRRDRASSASTSSSLPSGSTLPSDFGGVANADDIFSERSYLTDLERVAKESGRATTDYRGNIVIEVVGVVESKRDFDNGFSIARVEVEAPGFPGGHTMIEAKGTLAPEPGCVYRFVGTRAVHPRFGESLAVSSYDVVRPSGAEAIRRFLSSGLFPHLGAKRAGWLVDTLGEATLDILDSEESAAIAALTAVRGVTEDRARKILEAYRENRKDADVLTQLYKAGVTPNQAKKIIGFYGPRAKTILTEDPYKMMYDIDGFGFLRVDEIAKKAGMADNDPRRNRAGVVYVLEQAASDEGHTWLPTGEMTERSVRGIRLCRDDVQAAIDHLVEAPTPPIVTVGAVGAGKSNSEGPAGYARTTLHAQEAIIANRLVEAIAAAPPVPVSPKGSAVPAESLSQYSLTPEQQAGVIALCQSRLGVLTGGPGVGKTYTLKALIGQWEARGERVMQAAPTGKAAVRMSEATGRHASTIHRLLDYGQHGFGYGPLNPLPPGHIVIDETSMVDVPLMAALVSAINFEGSTLTLVGDVDQLPSVGPGAVLSDVIESGIAPVCRLTRIMRQAEGSAIIRNAHRIIHGDMPEADNDRLADWQYFNFSGDAEAAQVADELVAFVTEVLPGYGYDPIKDVQVLTPMRKLALGVGVLNARLQAILNPPSANKPEERVGGKGPNGSTLRLGDKVMQRRNNYSLDVFNGEVGVIVEINRDGILVDFGDGTVLYPTRQDWQDLAPAYACTCHKFQGSQVPVVVTPVHSQHWIMLGRQLLYTAVTRAQEAVILFGSDKALKQAVKNTKESERHTLLKGMLRGSGGGAGSAEKAGARKAGASTEGSHAAGE